ncbi:MAG: histidine kinase [Flavobacteriaceae bacterium]
MKELLKISKYSIIISVCVFFIERSLVSNGFNNSITNLLLVFAVHFLYSFVITFVNFKFIVFLNTYFPIKEYPKKRLFYGIFGSIILTMLAIVMLRLFTVLVIEKNSFETFLNTDKSYYIFSFILSANVLITVYAIHFYKALSSNKVEEQKVVSKTESAKFESLKNQLDPHFLFNSLNVLTSLIEENPKQAEKFTTKLSKIYRYVLQQKNQDLIEVNKELQFAKNYMALLKLRFENAIDFNIPETLQNDHLKIVPLALQLLLENAIKHNVISETNKLYINISQENNYLVIKNNINPKSNLEKSTKVGLNNIIDRYALITTSNVIIEKTDTEFIVKLPLLLKNSKIMNTLNQQEKYNRAKAKVKEMKDFYSSLIAYLFTMPLLYFIWYNYTSNTIQWFWFPIFGWGMGLTIQGFIAFSKGSNWETKKIKELMDNDQFDNHVRF